MDITIFIEIVVTLVVAVLTVLVIPYVKRKVKTDKLEEIMMWVRIAVRAAEMIVKESGQGAKKKEHVLKFIRSKGYKIDEGSLDNMIESAVLELKKALGV